MFAQILRPLFNSLLFDFLLLTHAMCMLPASSIVLVTLLPPPINPRNMSMLENQAFGWLKKSIMGGGGDPSSSSTNDEEIAGCSDPSILVDGVARDFNMLLMMNGNTAGGSLNNVASSVGGTNSDAAIAEDSSVSKSEATGEDGAPTSSNTSSNESSTANGHLNDLTSRLDRIKTLLYEERSASSQSVTQSGTLNLNWTPSIATGVFKSFTTARTSSNNETRSSDNEATTKVDITSNNSITNSNTEFTTIAIRGT